MGEYGYGEIENVITLQQFLRLIEMNREKLVYKGRKINRIAYIYCVGSRQENEEDGNNYCSRYCCTSALHSAVMVKNKYKDIYNIHVHRGIRTYGKQELIFEESSKQGDIHLQFFLDNIPHVEKSENGLIVKVVDILTEGQLVECEVDLVVLVTGMIPRHNNQIGDLLKLPKGRDKFYNEIHMKLRPVETVIDGVLIAGASQGPKNILETLNSSLAAAAKAHSVLVKGEMSLEPKIAIINPEICTWCDKCREACPYDGAIYKATYNDKEVAYINEAICKGCGMCTPVCPVDAIDIIGFENTEIEAMIDALIEA
jgi:heterodisulfide reductase subunit A